MKTALEITPWDKKYEIGHEQIDSQHRTLVMLMNKLVVSLAKGVNKEHLFRVLNELKKYAEYHFLSEENIMHDCFFPGIKNHQKIHAQILFELTVLWERVAQERVPAEEIAVFLKNWLLNHIAHEDAFISRYISEHPRP